MLKVTIEVVPHGDESRSEIIAFARINNALTNPNRPEIGDYYCVIFEDDNQGRHVFNSRVRGWDRSQSVLDLVAEALTFRIPGKPKKLRLRRIGQDEKPD